jgi:hypothetical protein
MEDYGMDNIYWKQGCPALMSDGRLLTNYNRGRIIDQSIKTINKIESAQEYKYFLQNNGENIINNERDYINKKTTCSPNNACYKLL